MSFLPVPNSCIMQITYLLVTARKRSLGQGNMFTGVCLSTGGILDWGVWSGGYRSWGVPAPGGCACSQGVWSQRVPAPGGSSPRGRGCLLSGGLVPEGCLVETPTTATAAGGTHPTGMHSCFCMRLSKILLVRIK